jgi:hypothetical protein
VKRRDFITLLGGAAAIWPLAAGAQQPPKTAKVGILYPGTTATLPSRIAALREGLRAAGYREPDNVELLPRAAEGDPNRIAPLAMELAERKVDVMVPVSPAGWRITAMRGLPYQAGLNREAAAPSKPTSPLPNSPQPTKHALALALRLVGETLRDPTVLNLPRIQTADASAATVKDAGMCGKRVTLLDKC